MNEQKEFEAWWDKDCDTTMNPYSNTSMMYWAWEAWKAGRKAEREACAKLVDEEMADYRYGTPPNIALNNAAAAIRARGQNV